MSPKPVAAKFASIRLLSLALLILASACSGPPSGEDSPEDRTAANASSLITDTAAASARDLLPQYHPAFVQVARAGNVDLVFFGDSITDYWRNVGLSVWNQYFHPLKAVDFGVGGDKTQNVLWRIRNGELQGIRPKLAMLMVGINNLAEGDAPEDVALGIKAIVHELQQRSPGIRILLHSILPTNFPGQPGNLPAAAERVNHIISGYANGSTVVYLNLAAKFRSPSGEVMAGVFRDGVHPTLRGYQIWADNSIDTVRSMMAGGGGAPPPRSPAQLRAE